MPRSTGDVVRALGNGLTAAVALALAWMMKDFYRRAGTDDLEWLLAPTVKLTSLCAGTRFELEPGHGYLSRELRYEIVPACAGVNFLVAAFLCLGLGLAHTCSSWLERLALLVSSAGAALVTTVLANTARLSIAARLHAAGSAFGPLTPARLHCAVGVGVYFLFLIALFSLAARVRGPVHEPAR